MNAKTKKNVEVLFFHADWCRSCNKMNSAIEELSKTHPITKIDVETEWGVDMSCKYEVRNVPQTLIVKDGKVLDRIKGKKTKSELKEIIEKWK